MTGLPFSAVVGVRYDRNTGEPLEADLLTPIYRHER